MVRSWRQCRLQTATAKNSGTKTTLNVFVSLLTQAWFTLNSEVNLDIQTAWACQFRSCCYLLCALCMWRLKCRTHYACCCFCARAKPDNESQLKKRKRKYRCFLKMYRSSTEITKKPWWVSQVSLPASFSEVRRGAHNATQIHQQLQQRDSAMFIWYVICVIYAAVLDCFLHSFIWKHN